MNFQITRGKSRQGLKILVYAPEGVGKSTFASKFPDVVFVDTEGSTAQMDVARLPKPQTLDEFVNECLWVAAKKPCRTFAVDTLDWLEKMVMESMCREMGINSIDEIGYGKGYTFLTDRMSRVIDALDEVVQAGIHVVLLAHCQVKHVEEPGMDPYDRWELKLLKRDVPLFKEWVDALFFAKFEIKQSVDAKGNRKAVGGKKRVMFADHNVGWDAKNRFGLPAEMPFEYDSISYLIEDSDGSVPVVETAKPEPEQVDEELEQMMDELQERCAQDGIGKGQLESFVWIEFDDPEVRNKEVQEWPKEFVGFLLENWSHVQGEIGIDGSLSITDDTVPF